MINTDLIKLKGPILGTYSGASPKSIVVLLHGYGSNGEDLISLANHWKTMLPDTLFVSPNAPFPCSIMPYAIGYQWFALPSLDLYTLSINVSESLPVLQRYIDCVLEEYNLSEKNLALVGFSQGCIMSISAGLSRGNELAGIVGYSGAYLPDNSLPIQSKPEILLVHGNNDDVVPISYFQESIQNLRKIGVKLQDHICFGLDHSIDEQGIALGGAFLREKLYKEERRNGTQ